MLQVYFTFPYLEFDTPFVAREVDMLADRMAQILVAQNQITLLEYGKRVSGDTLRSVQWDTVTSSPELQVRRVIADAGFKFIRDGRKAGKPMPVYVAGATKTGRLLYEPLPTMLRWFQILAIPRSKWFPIMRRISIKGIKPLDVPSKAIRSGTPAMKKTLKLTSGVIARGIIKRIA